MKTSQVFRKAKKHLAMNEYERYDRAGKDTYICSAIELCGVPHLDIVRTQEIIKKLLGTEHYTFTSWLSDNGVFYPLSDYLKLQETRQAWLDHLIEHYERIGE